MKSQRLTSKELLEQLQSEKNDLFTENTSKTPWQGLEERHLDAIRMIPKKTHHRALIRGTGLLGTFLAIGGISLYIWIVDTPQPQPTPLTEQTTTQTTWYATDADSWEDLIDTSETTTISTTELEIDSVLDTIPDVEQNFYVIDMQLQWLAQPQW